MQPDLNVGDVGVDPEAQNRYERAMQRQTQMPAPPPVDHPLTVFAQKILAPLGNFGNQERTDMAQPAFQQPINKVAPRSLAGLPAPDFGPQQDLPYIPPLNAGAPAKAFEDVPVLGGALRYANQTFANAPLGENGAIAANKAYRDARVQYGANSPEAQQALENWGTSALNVVAGLGGQSVKGEGPRFTAETGASRSLVRDTVTGKTEPTIFAGADHAAQAEAAAQKLNAQTGTAADAGIAVAPEAGIRAALNDLTNVKTAEGNIGRTVRVGARELGLTAEDLVNSPEMNGQIMAALARAKVPASDVNIASVAEQLLAQEKARPTVGNKNYTAVREALGAPEVSDPFAIPKPVNVPASAEQTAANAGATTAAQATQADILRAAIAKKEAALAKTETGPKLLATSPNEAPIPFPPTRATAGQMAGDAILEVNSLFRAALAGGDLSTVLLQGAPALVTDISKLPFYAVEAARGGAQRPFFHSALGRMAQAMTAGPGKMAEITQGFRDTLEANGLRPGKDVFISDPMGAPLAREEFTAGALIQKLPVLGLIYRQGNFATATFLNALRTGMAVNLKRAYDQLGIPFERDRVGHLTNIVTGRGDLPFGVQEGTDAAKVLQGIFFGPRLMTAAFQNVTDTIGSVLHAAADAPRGRLKPVDVARIHNTAAFVATGWGIMQLAQASGLDIGTDPTKTDFGRITLPGGHRVDFWGPFNEEARLIAREIAQLSNAAQGAKPKFGAPNGLSLAQDYLRSKLGPVASAGASVLAGTNQAGQTPSEVVQSTLKDPNPLSNPKSLVPAPFTAQTAAQAFNPAQGGQGGLQGAIETGLGALGVSILPSRNNVPKDGLGRPEGSPNYVTDEIISEYENLNPGKTLTAPDSTIGSGKNTVKLPSTQAEAYISAVGEARRVDLGNLIYSPAYQAMTQDQKAKAYNDTKTKADNRATKEYLANDVVKATDPKTIAAEAVAGYKAQGGSAKNEAYWVALLDRAGKLTPEVAKAIDESNVTMPGQRAPITVEEMRNDAPLVHEYLSHVPYGSDKTPIGTPADWVAVEAAKQQQSVLKDQMIRSGINPSLAEVQAKQQTLQGLTNVAQRSLFLNGSSLVNAQRKQLATKYGTRLTRYLGGNDVPYTQESAADYPGR